MPFKFLFLLLLAMVAVFALHLGCLNYLGQPLFQNQIVTTYLANFALATLIFFVLHRYRFRFQNALGFLFMGGSFLKFIVFFVVFYPSYKSDGQMQRAEFAAFFIPYLTALIFETAQASKMLNSLQKPKD